MSIQNRGQDLDVALILAEVLGLDGDAMRGTDWAALASVLGALNDAVAAGAVTDVDTIMQYIKQVVGNTNKIDSLATDGLAGTSDSLAYRMQTMEEHNHSRERWFGLKAVPTGTDWGDQASLNPYRAISGNGVFGADANDEALVLGTDDTPAIADMVMFDLHRILILELSVDTPYIFRIIYGADTMANEESAGNYTDFMVQNNPAGSKAAGFPVDLQMPRAYCGVDQVWVRVMCATDNATADFFAGLHEYEG